ncbi:RidA family protein [Faunimonas sp. B44]|uniref:RidA family protein n=1 Tax=Faunimonas sp. B44 TaxID=3461493 RepID=UPI00404398C1
MRQYLTGQRQQQRAYSRAVVTGPGRTIWLAGQTVTADEDGRPLGGDFDSQAHAIFRAIERTLKELGSALQDIVTMTVFIADARHGDRFVEIRKSYFPDGFPASALITVTGFARPEAMLEIQAIAVREDGA